MSESDSKTNGSLSWPEDPGDATVASTIKPTQVKVVFWLTWVGAALSALQAAVFVYTRYFLTDKTLHDQVVKALQTQKVKVDAKNIDAMMSALSTTAILSIIVVVIWAVMAFMLGRPYNWARITATVLGVLNIGWYVLISRSPLQLISLLVGFVIIAMLWSPKAKAWYAGTGTRATKV